MKAYCGMDIQLHTFLTSALDGGEWSVSRPDRFTKGNNRRYPLDRRLGGPQSQAGRGGEEKNSQPLPGIEIRFLLIEIYCCKSHRTML
jgi:hypothetical protein